MDLTLAGLRAVKVSDIGDVGASGVMGIGGGGGRASDGTTLISLGLAARASAAFLVAERRPAGRDDLGRWRLFEPLPDVDGLLPSSDGRGRGPSLTFGFEYCA